MHAAEGLLNQISQLVKEGLTPPITSLFTENIEYFDTIYGHIQGKGALTEFFNSWWKDGRNYQWKFYDTLFQEDRGYASFTFSYTMLSQRLKDPQIIVPGTCYLEIKDNKINKYRETINPGFGFAQMKARPKFVVRALNTMEKRDLPYLLMQVKQG